MDDLGHKFGAAGAGAETPHGATSSPKFTRGSWRFRAPSSGRGACRR
jgi:hypothetical protein